MGAAAVNPRGTAPMTPHDAIAASLARRRVERREHWRRTREAWKRPAEVDRPCQDGRCGGNLPRDAGPWVKFCTACNVLRQRDQAAAYRRAAAERARR